MLKSQHFSKKLARWVINFSLLLLQDFILKILQFLNLQKNIKKKVCLLTQKFKNKNLLVKKMVTLVLNIKEKLVLLILMLFPIQ